jgi:hypothetical protein
VVQVIWVILVLVIGTLVAAIALKERRPPEPIDPEQAVRAAVELHAIRRRLDTAWTKSEQRRDSARLRREIAEALDEPRERLG